MSAGEAPADGRGPVPEASRSARLAAQYGPVEGGRCDACGRPLSDGDHAACRERRAATDPPRFCATCGRKLRVQVLPAGWRADCVRCDAVDAA